MDGWWRRLQSALAFTCGTCSRYGLLGSFLPLFRSAFLLQAYPILDPCSSALLAMCKAKPNGSNFRTLVQRTVFLQNVALGSQFWSSGAAIGCCKVADQSELCCLRSPHLFSKTHASRAVGVHTGTICYLDNYSRELLVRTCHVVRGDNRYCRSRQYRRRVFGGGHYGTAINIRVSFDLCCNSMSHSKRHGGAGARDETRLLVPAKFLHVSILSTK